MKPHIILVCGSIGIAANIALISGCGIRRIEGTKQLETASFKEKLTSDHYQLKQVTELFNDTLKGSFQIADTSGLDSTEFESNGIKIKVKVTGGKPGTKIDFKAIAKPVARSTLSAEQDHKTDAISAEKKALKEENKKTVNSLNGWVWFALILLIFGLVWLIINKVKKKISA